MKKWHGFKISKYFLRVTLYSFDKNSQELISVGSMTPPKGMQLSERIKICKTFLSSNGLALPSKKKCIALIRAGSFLRFSGLQSNDRL